MTIENTLLSIDTTLKSLLVIAQTGANATAEFGAPGAVVAAVAAVTKAKTKPAAAKAEPSTTPVSTDDMSISYFHIPKHNTVGQVAPGEDLPSIESTVEVSRDEYETLKADYAKKSATGAQTTPPAAAATPPAAAATVSPSVASASFEEVVAALTTLSKDARPGKGRDAIMALLAKHLPDMPAADRKVPKLAALKKNDELLAEVEALNAPDTLVEDDVFA